MIAAIFLTAFVCIRFSYLYYNGQFYMFPPSTAKLNAVIKTLDARYYEEYDKEKAIDAAVEAYVDSLGDPYTEYMNKSSLENFYHVINSSYSGIGVSLKVAADDNTIVVEEVFDGSPAKKAGIMPGDVILKANGKAFSGEQLDGLIEEIQESESGNIKLTLLQKSSGKEIDVDVVSEEIVLDSVTGDILEENIGYIAISQFATNTADEFKKMLKDMEAKNVVGLIVDVRDNGGGITDAVESVCDCLLPKGKVIYYTADKNDKRNYAYSKKEGTKLPLVVLANGHSASASEILIGAVKDNKRGVIVGEKSYGKGVVQEMYRMAGDTALKVTVERYFTPNGNYINKKGIEPDYTVHLIENDRYDYQMEKAVKVILKED